MGGMDTLKQNKFYARTLDARKLVEDIEALKESYRYALRVLKEDEARLIKRSKPVIVRCTYVTMHIENVIESLDEKHRFILTNEFILGKRGKWFTDYYSESTYYRSRIKAYRAFLVELER